jgi:hypothetical protein
MQGSNWMQMGGLIVIGGLFLFCSVYLLYSNYGVQKRIATSASWPETMGRVTQANVRLKNTIRAGRHYLIEVAYTYSVRGVEYVGKFTVDPLWSLGTKTAAEQKLSLYPAGAPVSIRYNPEKPQDHVTEQDGVTAGSVILTLFFIFLTIMVVWLLFQSSAQDCAAFGGFS